MGMFTTDKKHFLTNEDVENIIDMYEYGYSIRYIAHKIDCSVSTIDNFISDLKEEAKISPEAKRIIESRDEYVNFRREKKKKKKDGIPTINDVVVKALAHGMSYGQYMQSGLYEKEFGEK